MKLVTPTWSESCSNFLVTLRRKIVLLFGLLADTSFKDQFLRGDAAMLSLQYSPKTVASFISGRGSLILKEIYEISLAGRNPKQDPLLMALALCAR